MTERANHFLDLIMTQTKNNTSKVLGRINNQSIFIYVIIFVICLFLAKIIHINLSVIFFLGVALLICYLIYSYREINDITNEKQSSIKLETIIPRPQNLDNYPDLIDFLFRIRKMYHVNPNEFYGIVNSMDLFIRIYEEIMYDKIKYCVSNLEVAIECARTAQNHLQAMIYNLSTDHYVTAELHESMDEFQVILYQYISKMIKKCNRCFNSRNMNQTLRYYDPYQPHPANYYDYSNGNARFQFY